jgi:alanine dehydrogenase
LIIGVPKEIKPNEHRVSITPAGVETLVSKGHQLLIETGAGLGSGLADVDYTDAGAVIALDSRVVYQKGEMILKVKELFPVEFDRLREGQLIFTYLHSAGNPQETQALLDKKVVAIAYEDIVTDSGEAPLLAPMSEIAGEVAVIMGAYHMFTIAGGNGMLIGGAAGASPAKVVILGAGNVGLGAARYATGLGADVTIMDLDLNRLREVRLKIFPQIRTLFLDRHNVRGLLPVADLLVNGVKWPPGARDHIVTREMLQLMKRTALIVDISCDPAGAIETCRITTHDCPIYEVDGIRHFCVDNLPSAVAKTSSTALCNASLPYVIEIADKGWLTAVRENRSLRRGLGFAFGHLTFKPTADVQNRVYTPPEEVIEMFSSGTSAPEAGLKPGS